MKKDNDFQDGRYACVHHQSNVPVMTRFMNSYLADEDERVGDKIAMSAFIS